VKILDLPENWNVLLEKLTGLGEQIFGKNYYPELQDRLAELEKIQSLLNQSNDAIFLVEAPSGNLGDANEPACRQMGRSREELLDMTLYELSDPETANSLADILKETTPELPEKQWIIGALRRKDGCGIPVEIHFKRVALGEKPYVVAVAKDITDRKKAEEDLRKERDFLSGLIQSSPAFFVTVGADGKTRMMNHAMLQALGYELDEVVGKDYLSEFIPAGEKDRILEAFAQLRENKQVMRIENRVATRDGRELLVEWNGKAMFREDGRFDFFFGVGQDITERRRVSEALRESKRALSHLIGNLPGMSYRCCNDRDWTMEFVSKGCEDLTGYQPSDLVGNKAVSFAELIHPDDREQVWNRVQEGVEKKKPFRLVYRIITSGKEEKWVWEQGSGVFSESGELTALEGIIFDITERRKAVEALRESREYHLSTLDAIPDLVYELALDGTIIYANRTASETLGIEPDQHGTIRFADFLDEAGAERSLEEFRKTSETKSPSQNVFYHLKTAGGAQLPVEVHATLVERKDQPPTILCVARDITYRRQLEGRFRQSQKMEAVGRLAGGIAHDFNNLMTAITGYSDLLLLNLREGDPLREQVEEIRKAGDMANALTRQLMAFTRKQFLQPQVFELNEVVTEMEKVLRRFIGEDIDLITDLAPTPGHVRSDKSQIEQVILNLTLNSRDAMSQGGKILIETRNVDLDEAYAALHAPLVPGPYVMLALTDTGIGMEEEIQGHIFEPFFTTKEKEMGTGLGLSAVYGTVKQSGGFIWVYSEIDHGTTFKIYMPRVRGEEVPEEPPVPPQPTTLEGSETILLVEDQDSLRKMACEVLKKKGYKVLDAHNAGEAILISEEHTGLIHLMLTDVVMPRVGGRDLFERLQPWHPEMKVLFMSGYTDSTVVQQGLLDPGVAFLEKPFSPQDLAQKVRQVLNTARTVDPGNSSAG